MRRVTLYHVHQPDVRSCRQQYARIFEACDKVAFDINRLDELDRVRYFEALPSDLFDRIDLISTQVLCIAAAAVTASVQQCDRKFGVGQSAIVIQEPLAIKKDLETRVLEEADRLGILRKPSLRTLETLRLFCILTSGPCFHLWYTIHHLD